MICFNGEDWQMVTKTGKAKHSRYYQVTSYRHDNFIIQPLGSSDWLLESNDSLWNDQANTNCSCPDGWRVPTSEELAMEMNSWISLNMEGAYNSALKWVSTGNRDNHGTERYSTYWGFYWSSTTSVQKQVNVMAIIASSTAEIISGPRISGHAIRCIRDY
ncbi:MAG: hypothetical protein IPG79_17015 [Saprospiraceae bacterium]|nr:hypothetical protein [Saprospiraceae bacterium]